MEFIRFSQVTLTRDLSEVGLCAGDVGKIINRGGAGYEVDFFQTTGREEDVFLVPGRLLRSASRNCRDTADGSDSGDRSAQLCNALEPRPISPFVSFADATVHAIIRFGFFVGGVCFMFVVVSERNDRNRAIGDFGGSVCCVVYTMVEVWLYQRSLKVTEGGWPFPPRLAMRMSVWPHVFRILPFTWYAAHFAFAVLAALWMDRTIMFSNLPMFIRIVSGVAVMFTVSYSANIYALLSLRAIGSGEAVVGRAWKWRIGVDVAISLVAAYFPLFVRVK